MKVSFLMTSLLFCQATPPSQTLKERFSPPAGYSISHCKDGSFGEFLQNLPLKKAGTHVYTYRSEIAHTDQYAAAVVDLPLGTKDLQQCADAIIRLRAEYLWKNRHYSAISFNFTSGFRCDYVKFAEGYRYQDGAWKKKKNRDYTYKTFNEYLELVYTYAGTLSLEKQLKKASSLDIGTVFIKGGSPGHCFMVVNKCIKGQDTLFQLVQSFMPAQDIQVLKHEGGSWFSLGTITEVPYAELISRRFMRVFD